MQVTLQSTSKIVELIIDGVIVPARLWEGTTASGIACHAYITRIAVAEDLNAAEFERDLQYHVKPSPAVDAIPLRLVL